MRRNLRFTRGTTKTFSGVLRDEDGDPIDLTNAVGTWKFGDRHFCRTAKTLTESDGITFTAGTGGQWSITIDPADARGYVLGIGGTGRGVDVRDDGALDCREEGNLATHGRQVRNRTHRPGEGIGGMIGNQRVVKPFDHQNAGLASRAPHGDWIAVEEAGVVV